MPEWIERSQGSQLGDHSKPSKSRVNQLKNFLLKIVIVNMHLKIVSLSISIKLSQILT